MVQTRAMAVWRLPWSLRLEGSLSEAVLEASLDGASVELHLPIAEPVPIGAAPQILPALAADSAPSRPWTTTVEAVRDARGVTVFDVHRIVLVDSEDSALCIDAWTGRELAGWFAKVTDWLEVWTGQMSDPAARSSQQPVWGEDLERWTLEGDGWRHEAARIVVDCSVPASHEVRGRAATYGELASALERVATGHRPTMRDLLIRDARGHLLRGEPRRAALDAGLAAELMLAVACEPLVGADGRLPGKSATPLSKATLGPLVSAAPKLDVCIPAGLNQDLVDVRNAAAHGRELSVVQVEDLLGVVVELRSLLVPGWMDGADTRFPR
jgi:hypothetical protein